MLFELLVCLTIAWVCLVRHFRYQRIRALEKKYGSDHETFDSINYRNAQSILGQMAFLECPWTFLAGKDFAFLRAFAIPGISKVSVGAREMIDRPGKRYADTTVLVGEWLVNDIDSERACTALNRVNWIHSRYGDAIKMDQMVYTLCLLVSEALEWIDRYDWRKTTPLEKHASYIFWKEVGRRMGLTGVPESYEACVEFITNFELQNMGPSAHNTAIAEAIFHLYASTIPSFLGPLVKSAVVSFMDDQLRTAFKLEVSWTTHMFQNVLMLILNLRKIIIRNFLLPRHTIPQIFGDLNTAGLRHMNFWEIEPWYVKRTLWNQYGPTALYARLFSLPIPAQKWADQGYKIQGLGPMKYEGRGEAEVLKVVNSRSKGGNFVYSTFGWRDDRTIEGSRPLEGAPRGPCPMLSSTKARQIPASCPMTKLSSHTTRASISSTCPIIQ